MTIKLASKNLLISLLILASVFLFSQISKSYDDKTTHPGLTDEIVDFYNLSFDEKLTNEEKEWIVQGSIDEDTPPRWINHFYDPIYKVGWSGDKTGIWPRMVIQYFSTGVVSSHDPVSSLYWLHSQDLQAQYGQYKGNRTWERAIYEMVQNGNKKEAYYTLGFILHLIEDATVPDHTRNDTHAHELRYGTLDYGSPYEEFSKQHTRQTLNIANDLKNENKQPIIKSTIDEYLISLAEYSNKYFFSKDTINTTDKPKYEFPKITRTDESFGYGIDENKIEFPLVNLDSAWSFENFDFIKIYYLPTKDNQSSLVLKNYFSRLSRQAVLNGAGIINLFKQEAAKAEKEKLQNLPDETSSVWSPTGRLYQLPNFLSQTYNSLSNFAGNFTNSLSSNISSAINYTNTQFQNNKQSLTTSSFLLLQNSFQEKSNPALALVPPPPQLPKLSPQQPPANSPQPTPTPPANPPPTPQPTDNQNQPTAQPPAQNNQNNAVPWPGFVFAAPQPQEETNNSQFTTNDTRYIQL